MPIELPAFKVPYYISSFFFIFFFFFCKSISSQNTIMCEWMYKSEMVFVTVCLCIFTGTLLYDISTHVCTGYHQYEDRQILHVYWISCTFFLPLLSEFLFAILFHFNYMATVLLNLLYLRLYLSFFSSSDWVFLFRFSSWYCSISIFFSPFSYSFYFTDLVEDVVFNLSISEWLTKYSCVFNKRQSGIKNHLMLLLFSYYRFLFLFFRFFFQFDWIFLSQHTLLRYAYFAMTDLHEGLCNLNWVKFNAFANHRRYWQCAKAMFTFNIIFTM